MAPVGGKSSGHVLTQKPEEGWGREGGPQCEMSRHRALRGLQTWPRRGWNPGPPPPPAPALLRAQEAPAQGQGGKGSMRCGRRTPCDTWHSTVCFHVNAFKMMCVQKCFGPNFSNFEK